MGYVGKVTAGGSTHLVGSTLYGVCDTDGNVADKVVTCSDFTNLIEGVTIHVKFNNTNTVHSGLTLNVNGTGAKPIRWYPAQYTDSDISVYDVYNLMAGNVYVFTYDGTNWAHNNSDYYTHAQSLSLYSHLYTYTTDLNEATHIGMFQCATYQDYTNLPPIVTAYVLVVDKPTLSGGLISQIAYTCNSTNTAFIRGSTDGGTTWSKWSNLFNEKHELANNVNLNNVIFSGIYMIRGSYTYTNIPSGVTWGTLIVTRSESTDSTPSIFITQLMLDSGTRICSRESHDGGSTWSNWIFYYRDTLTGKPGVNTNTNLNTVTEPGIYTINGSSTYTNLPSGVTYGLLTVTRQNVFSFIEQKITVPDSTNAVYVRHSSNSGSAWQAWTKLVTPSDWVAKSAILGMPANTTKTFTVSNNGRYHIDTIGSSQAVCGSWIVNVTSAGAITIKTIGAASDITFSSGGANKLLAKNNSTGVNPSAYITIWAGTISSN